MSDTPRTDAAIIFSIAQPEWPRAPVSVRGGEIVYAHDMRTLERDLTRTREALREALDKMETHEFFHDGLEGDLAECPDKAHAYVQGWLDAIEQLRETDAQLRKENGIE